MAPVPRYRAAVRIDLDLVCAHPDDLVGGMDDASRMSASSMDAEDALLSLIEVSVADGAHHLVRIASTSSSIVDSEWQGTSGTLPEGSSDTARVARAGARLAGIDWALDELFGGSTSEATASELRQRTIIKVASEIVKQQEAFFLHGVAHLKPLTLARVAEAIGMHESTVSRVTSNKYLSCARGLFELKFFFTSGIAAADGGDAVSAEAVKSAIKALIANEDAKILSDDTLVELLQAKGFDIARRTVAKYRESMGIGSSVQRRRARTLNG